MRVLVLDDTAEAQALHRDLADRHDVRRVGTLGEALEGTDEEWQPDAVVLRPTAVADADPAVAELSHKLGDVPIVLTLGGRDAVSRQVDALAHVGGFRREEMRRRRLRESRAFEQAVVASRDELLAEIDVVARRAAEQAVQRAVERLMARLGLDDDDGVRTAIRLARAYEEARARFWSAITTGLASGLLVALAWGIWTMVHRTPR